MFLPSTNLHRFLIISFVSVFAQTPRLTEIDIRQMDRRKTIHALLYSLEE